MSAADLPLELAKSYAPGFFSPQGVDLSHDSTIDGPLSAFRVETSTGQGVDEGLIGGWATSSDDNTGVRY